MVQGSPDGLRPLARDGLCPHCGTPRLSLETARQVFVLAGDCPLCEQWLDELDRVLLGRGCTRGRGGDG